MRHALRPAVIGLAIATACAACTGRDATPNNETPAPATVAAPTTIVPPPAVTTMPAPSVTTLPPGTTVAALPATGPMPAVGAISFLGFGPAHWGASEEQVRQAFGKELEGTPSEPNGCFYLFPAPRDAGGYRYAFMMEGGKLARIDVRSPDIAAPRGGRVGMPKGELLRLYPAIAEQKHKYVEDALNLRAMDPDGGAGTIVFETDANGTVTAWRTGVAPQVDYVEGCS